jgi:hypothetical protein
MAKPFYVFKRKGKRIYYVQFRGEGGSLSAALST